MSEETAITEEVNEEPVRKLASIRQINTLSPIEGADRIEVATIDGWRVVVKKGDFKAGDLCVYVEIDSILPDDNPNYDFLKNSSGKMKRIRTIRLRGEISQGIAFPLSILTGDIIVYKTPEPSSTIREPRNIKMVDDLEIELGIDLTEFLNVKKYEPEISFYLQGKCKSTFPSWISKTDEERIQNLPWIIKEHSDTEFYMTEKLDGTSHTTYLTDEFGVCSRNMDLLESEDNYYWQAARALKLEERMQDNNMQNFALQGEMIGPGIQGNKYALDKVTIRFFNVWDIKEYKYLNYEDFLSTMIFLDLQAVPYIGKCSLKTIGDMEQIITYANGSSLLNLTVPREGVVFRPLTEQRMLKGGGRLSFKAISNDFLETYGA